MNLERMKIAISIGKGEGPTQVAAFDAALRSAGVHNYNLIHLSSVIPPNAKIVREPRLVEVDEYGHRLYVVMARNDARVVGEEAWAGVGWTQERCDGRGLFVECTGPTDAAVRRDIELSLTAMKDSRKRDYGPIDCEVAGVRCEGRPVCALVVAVYESAAWK